MQLTNQEIKDFKSKLKCKQDILDYALEINKEVADDQDRDIVNLYAQSEALKLHMYLFDNVPSNTFEDYVEYVHKKLNRPYFLCAMPGVRELLDSVDEDEYYVEDEISNEEKYACEMYNERYSY
jgi:hypothetical protein